MSDFIMSTLNGAFWAVGAAGASFVVAAGFRAGWDTAGLYTRKAPSRHDTFIHTKGETNEL